MIDSKASTTSINNLIIKKYNIISSLSPKLHQFRITSYINLGVALSWCSKCISFFVIRIAQTMINLVRSWSWIFFHFALNWFRIESPSTNTHSRPFILIELKTTRIIILLESIYIWTVFFRFWRFRRLIVLHGCPKSLGNLFLQSLNFILKYRIKVMTYFWVLVADFR